jgi:multidrug resistance efflux pump
MRGTQNQSFCEDSRRRRSKRLPGLLIVAVALFQLSPFHMGHAAESTTSAPGRVESGSDVLSLGTAATGTIAELLVGPGAHVRTGQRLVRVECHNVENEVEARKADLAAAEAVYLRTLHGPRPEEISIGIANVNLADARMQEAERVFQRTQQLREGVTVTRVQIDQAQRDARMATALLEEVRAKLALLRAGSREEDITEARSRRDAAKERVAEAATRLGYCSVDAPVAGTVLTTNVSRGQLVSSMAPVPLLTMVEDGTRRRVRAFVDERDISKICPHQRASVLADGVPGMQFDALVEMISVVVGENPLATNAGRQFHQVVLSVDSQKEIPMGLRVTVQFLPCSPG